MEREGGKVKNQKLYKVWSVIDYIHTLSPRYDSSEECRASYLFSGGSYCG